MSTLPWTSIAIACGETFYMIIAATALCSVLGIPLGIWLHITNRRGISPRPLQNVLISCAANIIRSIPFIILLVAIIPLTRLIVGTSIGTTAAIVPLAIAATPFIARIVENTLNEIPSGIVEACMSMGASKAKIIKTVYLGEALPGIIRAITVTCVTLVGYSAMAGIVGGGGLGHLAYSYGYQRFNQSVMVVTVVILIIFVQGIQWLGDKLAKQVDHR